VLQGWVPPPAPHPDGGLWGGSPTPRAYYLIKKHIAFVKKMFLFDFIIILSLIMLVSKSLIHQQKSQENNSLNQANKGRVHEPRVRVQAEKIVDTYGRTRAAKRSLCDYHLSNDENKLQGQRLVDSS